MSFHNNYWSCSAFADWLRGTKKPEAETGEGWRDWKNQARTAHPVRFWLAEEALGRIQDFVYWPANRLYAAKYWLLNRFVTRTHALTSNLKRGEPYDLDTRMMNSMFDELVNFVELELAWMNIAFDSEARKKHNPPWWAYGWRRTRTWRCPESGLDYLNWASKLTLDEGMAVSPDHADYGKPTTQAIDAREILALYNWWKHERPKRIDPMDASGWTALCDERRKGQDKYDWFLCEDKTEEEKRATKRALDLSRKLERKYEREDDQMMIRLVRIRKSLWT